MKIISLTTLKTALIILSSMYLFTSCVTEGCTNPAAENYSASADTDDGSCNYARDEFLNSYAVSETCESGEWSYTLTITPQAGNDNGIVLGNLGGWETPANVLATVNGNNISFNDTKNGINFSGTGNQSGNTLTIVYEASVGGNTDTCTSVCVIE